MKNILVVDDEEHILTLIELSLKSLSHNLVKARDGNGAMAAVKKQKPDLVLLDLMLPGISGYDVCRMLKKKNIPVWILSAKGFKEDVKKGLSCGADDYITKPFDPEELEKKISNFFEG
jgi:DNA-binding response OmpR family regulator